MSFSDNRITDAQIAASGVQSQPNKLAGTAAENKAVFDALVENVVKAALNGLIDELLGSTAAAQLGIAAIPGYSAGTVQAALEEITQAMETIVSQGVGPNSVYTAAIQDDAVTGAKIPDGEIAAEKLASDILPANVGIKIGTATPTAADISEGQIYLKYS